MRQQVERLAQGRVSTPVPVQRPPGVSAEHGPNLVLQESKYDH